MHAQKSTLVAHLHNLKEAQLDFVYDFFFCEGATRNGLCQISATVALFLHASRVGANKLGSIYHFDERIIECKTFIQEELKAICEHLCIELMNGVIVLDKIP
jgi:hypothetical protein